MPNIGENVIELRSRALFSLWTELETKAYRLTDTNNWSRKDIQEKISRVSVIVLSQLTVSSTYLQGSSQ